MKRGSSNITGDDASNEPNEPVFDQIVREAASAIGTPIALISFLDEHRQWFKARLGLTMSETPLCVSFCSHAVRQDDVFEVRDASRDERFADNPLVTGHPHIRFYAGAPLLTKGRRRIGTICVIDDQVRAGLTQLQRNYLTDLACRIIDLLEGRYGQGLPITDDEAPDLNWN